MRLRAISVLFLLTVAAGRSQLTTTEKTLDFRQASGLFIKGYGPADWKKKAFGIDLLDTAPWIDRIRATSNDLEFYEVMGDYFASLNDAHVSYQNPSNFVARLNFSVDIYDGKLLVDFINRARLPAAEYPFVNGYELVSIDGQDAGKLLERFLKYSASANSSSTRRTAAGFLTSRPQWYVPDAPAAPEMSTVVFRRYNGGLETYRLPWTRTGVPLTRVGKFPLAVGAASNVAGTGDASDDPPPPAEDKPDYMRTLEQLWNCRLQADRAVLNFGAATPVFARALPPSFVQRLGRSPIDHFYSGVFEAGGYRVGFIRIPSYSPVDFNGAVNQFVQEIAYMQDRTDGLVIDEMRNPGGSVLFANTLPSLVHHYPWYSLGFELRATSAWVMQISSAYESAKAQGAPKETQDLLLAIRSNIIEGNRSERGLTKPIPIDDVTILRAPARDQRGIIAYTKPLMVLIDEFSASGGDAFAATIQDNGRGPLFGHRTMGAGGNVTNWDAGSYSEGFVSMTQSLMSRKYERAEAGGYPVSPYVENVGVHPEIEAEYMTRENLLTGGKPFVDAFVSAMIEHIRKNQ